MVNMLLILLFYVKLNMLLSPKTYFYVFPHLFNVATLVINDSLYAHKAEWKFFYTTLRRKKNT